MPLVTMCALNRDPLTNAIEVFESDCLARDDGLLNKLLADAVVRVFLEAGFMLSHAADTAFGVSHFCRRWRRR